jgi:hypothetical protein
MAEYYTACDEGHGYFAGEEDFCDQEGCAEKATVTYKVKKRFSKENPHEWNEPIPESWGVYVRRFCAKHSRRGDCAFDDADANYELIDGETKEPDAKDVKPSVFGGVIRLEN